MLTPSKPATMAGNPASTTDTSRLATIINEYTNKTTTLSLDCFDTLIWRNVAEPKDVFYEMQQRPLFKELSVTAYQRIKAAARAYRQKFISEGHRQVTLSDIYRVFTSLTPEQQAALEEDELQTEIDLCYAFPPMVQLIREAHEQGMQIIIVSDTYLTSIQLRRILQKCLPTDVMTMISRVFCSSEYKRYKSEGLFEVVKNSIEQPSTTILHIGDHPVADAEAPRKSGLSALQFIQFSPPINQHLRLQHKVSALTPLASIDIKNKHAVRYSPYRGVFSSTSISPKEAETKIGYLSFGPIMFAFARFVTNEIESLRQAGKNPKVFFLLRDAYLLHRACEAYAGEPVGKLVRIRKFVSVAASFRCEADIDHYLSSIAPQHFNMFVICEQLLLPRDMINSIIKLSQQSDNPELTFYQLLHQKTILQTILKNSSAYRERLKIYIQKEMDIQQGDTVVLVDTGYIGVTQEYLTRAFKNELQADIVGLYLMGSHEPDRPNYKSLLTSTWCEHGLLEQSCTFKEGCVLDYDNDGNPIYDKIRLSDEQYNRVAKLQSECLRFIHEAKAFYLTANFTPPLPMLQQAAMAALQRHIFFPTLDEINYFQTYQHDKDMGEHGKKTMYNINGVEANLKQQRQPNLHPYEARAASLQHTLSTLLQRGFDLEFSDDEASVDAEYIPIIIKNNDDAHQVFCSGNKTNNGYYTLTTPVISTETIGIVVGANYHWLQITSISLIPSKQHAIRLSQENIILDKLTTHSGDLFECQSDTSVLIITPPEITDKTITHQYQILFRPIIRRL